MRRWTGKPRQFVAIGTTLPTKAAKIVDAGGKVSHPMTPLSARPCKCNYHHLEFRRKRVCLATHHQKP